MPPVRREDLPACAACGLQYYCERYTSVDLASRIVQEKFKYGKDESNVLWNHLKTSKSKPVTIYTAPDLPQQVIPCMAKSFYEGRDGSYYHLHRELVHCTEASECLWLCDDCMKEPKKRPDQDGKTSPQRSIADGIDFGLASRISLPEPNQHERMILSLVRLYTNIIKVTSNVKGQHNKFKYSSMLFSHDAPHVATKMLNHASDPTNVERLKELLTIYLIDPDGNSDWVAYQYMARHHLLARWWVIASWLKILKIICPAYTGIDVPTDEEIRNRIQVANEEILRSTVIVKNKTSNEAANAIGSDAGQIQFTGITQPPPTQTAISIMEEKRSDGVQRANEEEAEHRDAGIDGILDMFNGSDKFGNSGGARDPLGDYNGDEVTLGGAFPTTFMFGHAYGTRAINYRRKQLRHLLHQFSAVPSKDLALMDYLDDCMDKNIRRR